MALILTPARRALITSAVRYGAVGILNTLVGFLVILALELGLKWSAAWANAGGYLIGVMFSFVLSRLFVFGPGRPLRGAAPRYVAAVLAAFGLNQLVLAIAGHVVPPGALGQTVAQGAAAVSYTVTLFLLSHYWVFRPQPSAEVKG